MHFYYLFAIFEILSDHPQFWFLVFLKCSFLEFQSYQIGIFYPLVDVSICFNPSLDFVLKSFSEVDIHFVLFEFVAVFLWETKTFYWIIWGLHDGDLMRITLLKFSLRGPFKTQPNLISIATCSPCLPI